MKVSELKENIRGIIRKKMGEAVVIQQTGTPFTDTQLSQRIRTLRSKEGDPTIGTEKNVVRVVRENDIKPGEYTMAKIWKMNRAELIDFLNLPPDMAKNWSDGDLLGGALEMADDRADYEDSIDEEDFMDDDDNTIIEDVEDVDSSGDGMAKYYDEVYEINANVAPGSRYQIEVRKNGNFIILTQDNGQEIVVNPEDVRDLVKVILKIDNESN
jgi:hypothetical protein